MIESFAGKRVTVVGLGRFGGGVGVTRWLASQGARVTVSDAAGREALVDSVAQLAGLDVSLHLGEHVEADFTGADLLVVNPAVPPEMPLLAAAAGARSRFYQAMLAAFERVDVLALPTAQCFAFPAEWHWPKEVGGRAMDSYHRWMEVTIYATLMGCSCATVPCGFDPEGRAMGMQLIGRPRADMATLQLAHAYQLATPFAAMRPGA